MIDLDGDAISFILAVIIVMMIAGGVAMQILSAMGLIK
jgi:hypothetical protein